MLPLKVTGFYIRCFPLKHALFSSETKYLLGERNHKSKLLTLKPLEGTELLHQHNGGNQAGQQIGNGHAVPHTCRIEEVGKDEQAGDEDEHLTGQ